MGLFLDYAVCFGRLFSGISAAGSALASGVRGRQFKSAIPENYRDYMFSDTHFHLHHLWERGVDMTPVFCSLAERNTFFALDIGTHCDDLPVHGAKARELVDALPECYRDTVNTLLHFSAGIWPAAEAIRDRYDQVALLERHIADARSCENFYGFGTGASKVIAIGECGLDHHWNKDGADSREEEVFTTQLVKGEEEMFEMQLELGKKFSLPVIVHSRDAFLGTLGCIKNVDYHRGIIHCYSYGIEEARAFLDLGWYISFSGSVTYTKKSKLDEAKKLLNYVPRDRMLLETDSPYLCPVPYRGRINTPVMVEYVYSFVAGLLEITPESLSVLVDANIHELFSL